MSLAVRLASPGGRWGHHQTLLFHRVLPVADPLLPGDLPVERFRHLMETLRRHFNVIPLREAVERAHRKTLPAASLSITFDDGYADNATLAAPVLAELGLSATFFVASGFLDGGRMWNDTVIETLRRVPSGALDLTDAGLGEYDVSAHNRADIAYGLIGRIKHLPNSERSDKVAHIAAQVDGLPGDLMMTSDQVRGLIAQGMDVGGHTVTHPILTRMEDREAQSEISAGRETLAAITGEDVPLFAYPNGKPGEDYDQRHVQMVRRAGFSAACSTARGTTEATTDVYQLPRFTPWDRSPARFVARLLANRWGLMR